MGTSVTLVKQFGNPTFNSLTVSGSINFTGSLNVTGSLTTVGNITSAGSITATTFTGSGAGLTGTANSLSIGGTAYNITQYTVNQSVGTSNSPTFQQVYANDWFRSYGSTGWYNQTYAGGWYMIDSTWIRSYNSKYVYVDSYIACGGDITAYYSDERLKKDITKIDGALAKVMALDGVYYTPNDFAMDQKVERKQDRKVGVIAQNVQKVLPEVVSIAAFDLDENLESKSGENYLTVKYDKLVPLLIEAIKEQQAQIEELKAKLG